MTGKVGFYLFAASLLLSTSTASVALGLMGVAFFCQLPIFWLVIRKEPILWLGLLFFPYLVCRMMTEIMTNPAETTMQLDASWAWMSMWAFIIISWWTENRSDMIYKALFLALVGFLVRIGYDLLFEVSPGEIGLFFQGIRTGLNYSVNAAGLYTATAIWGLVLMSPRFFQIKSSFALREGGIFIWIAGMIVMLHFCFITQSLSAMFSLAVVLMIMLPAGYMLSKKRRQGLGPKKTWLCTACVAAVLILTSIFLGDKIINRAVVESNTLFSIISPERQNIPKTALGLRFDMLCLGGAKFLQKPLTGWGPGTSIIHLFAQGEGYDHIRHYPHLHNTYLIVLVRLGVIGALFYFLGTCFYVRSLIRSYRSQLMPGILLFFFCGVSLLILLSSLASFHITDVDFRFYWLLLAGLAYSPHFNRNYMKYQLMRI